MGDEPHRPYNRTALSKQLLTGEYDVDDLRLPSFTDLDVQWRLGTPAQALDPARRVLTLPGAEQLRYDGLVIATGVEARVLPGTPLHSDRVWMLRTLTDAYGIDRALARASHRVAVVGGGFIGCELAATARRRGLDATIIDVSPTLLTRALGSALGAVVGDVHREAGVTLHLGSAVQSWQPHGQGVRLHLADRETVDADLVVVGIGTVPLVRWLAGSGLDTTDGVLADATCHAVGADDVVVAGDIARWPNLLFDDVPRRVEHWINAIEMGQAAADNLLAGRERAVPFTPVPRFWSEQHDLKIQSVGMPTAAATMAITEGSVAKRSFVATFTDDRKRMLGAVAFNHARQLLRYTPLVGTAVSYEPDVQMLSA